MKRDCTNCANMDAAHPNPVCEPCSHFTDGRAPTHWKAIVVAQAPAHPPSAPFTDTQRLEWLLPVMAAVDDPARVGDKRTVALSAAFVLGKSGREAIDFAMEGSP